MSVDLKPPAVEVTQATKRFGAKTALDAVDLTVAAGSFTVLLGPSGSGKTTLLRCVAGIERLTGGSITLSGRQVADGRRHHQPEHRNLAMVFQDYALWPHLTSIENVEFAMGRRRVGRAEATRQARLMLDRVGLAHLAGRYPNELSGGEQQRVALARALVGGTDLLLFDEPLSNLDADLRERMRLEIGTLARESGAASIYITHDQGEAFALADYVGVLNSGRLVQMGTPEEVYNNPASPFVARFTGLAGELAVAVEGAGSVDGHDRVAVSPTGLPRDPGGAGPILAHVPAGRAPTQTGTLLIRQAAVRLLPAGDPGRHLEAIVLDVAYRGIGYDHALLLADGTRLVGIHDKRRFSRGDHVSARLEGAGCLLFAEASTEAVPDAGAEASDGTGPVPVSKRDRQPMLG